MKLSVGRNKLNGSVKRNVFVKHLGIHKANSVNDYKSGLKAAIVSISRFLTLNIRSKMVQFFPTLMM